MADIELVIKIPEELFRKIDDENYQSTISWYDTTLYCAIKNGIPLPKGHGRLVDADAVYKDICDSIDSMTNIGIAVDGQYLWEKLNDVLFNMPTIIEADTERSRNDTD